jgi:hypothetical protein
MYLAGTPAYAFSSELEIQNKVNKAEATPVALLHYSDLRIS